MTAQLAKLGALTTTGAAPLAIQTLDQKYELKKTELESKVKYANKDLLEEIHRSKRKC